MTRAEVIDATGLSSATVSKLAARGVFVKIKAPGKGFDFERKKKANG